MVAGRVGWLGALVQKHVVEEPTTGIVAVQSQHLIIEAGNVSGIVSNKRNAVRTGAQRLMVHGPTGQIGVHVMFHVEVPFSLEQEPVATLRL